MVVIYAKETMSIIKKTDKALGGLVYVSRSAYIHPDYRGRAKTTFEGYADILSDMMVGAGALLDLPRTLSIRLTSMIKSNALGMYYWNDKVMQLDHRLMEDPKMLCTVAAHELIHAEQHFTGRLTVVVDTGEHIWNDGINFQYIRKWCPPEYAAYRNLPWEKEAYERQDAVADRLFADHFS